MITEDYVSLEVAKLLKERGFKEWCSYFYGTAVRHNGEDIDEDEEYELKAEGRGDEIEYVEGGHLYHFNCNNSKEDINIWACPTQSLAMKWLRGKGLHINASISYDYSEDADGNIVDKWTFWLFEIFSSFGGDIIYTEEVNEYDSYEQAVEAALKYSLENLI